MSMNINLMIGVAYEVWLKSSKTPYTYAFQSGHLVHWYITSSALATHGTVPRNLV